LKLGVFKVHSRISNPIASLFANVKNSANKTVNKNMGNVVDYVGYFSATDDYKPYYNPEVVQSFAHTLSTPGYVGSSSIPIAPPKKGTYQYGNKLYSIQANLSVPGHSDLETCVQYFKMICILVTDTCGSTIVVPLTYNRKVLAEQTIKPTYKSTDFPAGRTYPLVCNWNVQVFLVTV
jgi:hypothetical protein